MANLVVDFGASRGVPTGISSGLLHGMGPTVPADEYVVPLRMTHHRCNYAWQASGQDPSFYNRMTALGIALEISANHFNDADDPNDPYRQFYGDPIGNINNLADIAIARGQTFLWDIHNEPGGYGDPTLGNVNNFNPYWNSVVSALRTKIPTAKVIGPSLGAYEEGFIFSWLASCYAYSQTPGNKNVMPDYISWHELLRPAEEYFGVPHFTQHIASIRGHLAAHPEYGNPKLSINEYIVPTDQTLYSPGVAVEWMALGEREQIRMVRASWPHRAFNSGSEIIESGQHPIMGGLLTYNRQGYTGNPSPVPVNATWDKRGTWYAHKAYGDIRKPGSTMVTVAKVPQLDGIASVHAGDKKATILVGVRQEANQNLSGNYPNGNNTVTINNIPSYLIKDGKIKAKVNILHNSMSASSPTLFADQEYTVTGGTATIPVTMQLLEAATIEIGEGTTALKGFKVYTQAPVSLQPQVLDHAMLDFTSKVNNLTTTLNSFKSRHRTMVWGYMDYVDDTKMAWLISLLNAAQAAGLKVMPGTHGDNSNTLDIQMINATKNHPAILKHNGKPVYSKYQLQEAKWFSLPAAMTAAGLSMNDFEWWLNGQYATETTWIAPDTWAEQDKNRAETVREVNHFITRYGANAVINFAVNKSKEMIITENAVGAASNKPFIAGWSGFYASASLECHLYQGVRDILQAVIDMPVADRPKGLSATAWDLAELSYTEEVGTTEVNHVAPMPALNAGYFVGENVRRYLTSHSGIGKFAEPWLKAQRDKAATVTFPEDRLFAWYWTHPINAPLIPTIPAEVAAADSLHTQEWWSTTPYATGYIEVGGGNQINMIKTGLATEIGRIYAAAHLTAPAKLRINGVDSAELPAGSAFFYIPQALGTVTMAIVRGGVEVVSGSGPDITNSVFPAAWNFTAIEIEHQPTFTNTFVSGTNLQSSQTLNGFLFDPTNQLPSWTAKHIIEITGGTNVNNGNYRAYSTSTNNGNTLANFENTNGVGLATGTVSNGVWRIERGTTSGGGTMGSNLIGYYPNIFYDPDSPVDKDALLGAIITITQGTGYTTASYFVNEIYSEVGIDAIVLIPHNGSSIPGTTARGGHWHMSTPPLPINLVPTNTAYTGAIKLMTVGDSNTEVGSVHLFETINRVFPNATKTLINKGYSGGQVGDFQPGTTRFNQAVTDANAAGITVLQLCLGINNTGMDIPTYVTAMQNIIDGFYAQIPTLADIVVQEVHLPESGSTEDMNTALQTIGHGVTLGNFVNYDLFINNPTLLIDYKHPNKVGYKHLVEEWTRGLMPVLI